jgi:hypothetical protein
MLFFGGARARRERRTLIERIDEFARMAGDPATRDAVAFTGPLRSDEDRAHDTMFGARDGGRSLSFILDTSRARIRWWALYETFGPDGVRTSRAEASFKEGEPACARIRDLLVAARAASAPPRDPVVDPFDPVPDPPSQAASPEASAKGD